MANRDKSKQSENRQAAADNPQIKLRLDKWLWSARFFKTRGMATDAINGGKVHVDGLRVKASRQVGVGQLLEIRKGPYDFEVEIDAIIDKRGPASVAQTMYTETEESIAKRTQLSTRLRDDRIVSHGERIAGRPSKRERRQLHRVKGKDSASE